jgi:hypothetical protein
MRKFLIITATGVAALAAAAPAGAQHSRVAAAPGYHRSALEAALSARLQSIQTRIVLLREEGLMNSQEARDLRQQSRSLEQRLIGLNARDASDVELALGRLNDRVRFAAEDARNARALDREDDERFADNDRYELQRRSESEHLDRHIAPPVDRWEDPFDRGDEF